MSLKSSCVAGLVFLTVGAAAQSEAQTPLRAVFEGDLKVIAPNSTNAYVTRNFLNLTYDNLISLDPAGVPQPQMLDRWDVSADGMTYTFKLRPGLTFHDGSAVAAEDCVQSIKRWMTRDTIGKLFSTKIGSLEALGADTFALTLKEPFAHVLKALSRNLWIMPARLAMTDPAKPFSEEMGSGPFILKADEWVPGDRVVLTKNIKYVSRPEPANGLAGGKRAEVDRLELRVISDHATRIAALQKGEIDFIERPSMDYVEMLKKDKSLVVDAMNDRTAKVGYIAINHLQPPFNNVKVRQALQYAINSVEILEALGYSKEYGIAACRSVFACGQVSAFPFLTATPQGDVAKAKQLLREAGYKGEKIISLHTTNVRTIEIPATVIEEQLRAAGFNVEVAAGEFNTVYARSFSKEPLDKGGWSILIQHVDVTDMIDPLFSFATTGNCSGINSGWGCDEPLKVAFTSFLQEKDPEKSAALVRMMQARYSETVQGGIWGQITVPMIYRSSLHGMLKTGLPIMWNVSKAGR